MRVVLRYFLVLLLCVGQESFAVSAARTCAELQLYLSERFSLSPSQAKEFTDLLLQKGETDFTETKALLEKLPPFLPFGLRSQAALFGPLHRQDMLTVLQRLVSEDTGVLAKSLINAKELQAADRVVLEVLMQQSWVAANQSRWLKIWRNLSLTRFIEQAYQARKSFLGEHTTVEDFLLTFHIEQYSRIAELAQHSTQVPEILGSLRLRIQRIELEIATSTGLRRNWLKNLAARSRELVRLIENQSGDWRAEATLIEKRLSPEVWTWSLQFAKNSEELLKRAALAAMIGISSLMASEHMVAWSKAEPEIIFPAQPAGTIERELTPEQKQKLIEQYRDGTDLFAFPDTQK